MGAPDTIASWHPGIATSPVTDGVRHIGLEGGGDVEEPILEHSDDERFYVYAISKSPFDMTGYKSRISVEGAGEGISHVVWTGEFEATNPADADGIAGVFTEVYKAGLATIRDMTEAS
jgi:hypothetical protein